MSLLINIVLTMYVANNAIFSSLLFRVHPVELTMDSTEQQAIEAALATLQVTHVKSVKSDGKTKIHVPDLDDNYLFMELKPQPSENQSTTQQYSAVFKTSRDQSPVEITVLGGHAASGIIHSDNIKWQRPFIETPYFNLFISTVLQDHAIDTDICLVRTSLDLLLTNGSEFARNFVARYKKIEFLLLF